MTPRAQFTLLHNMKTSPWLIVTVAAVLAGCGDLGSPVAPFPIYPQVAGIYTGPATITAHTTGLTLTGFGRAIVFQSRNEVTIHRSLTFGGVESVRPAATGTINETGFFTLIASGAVPGPPTVSGQCGILTLTSQSLHFAGHTLTFQEGHQTTFCGPVALVATLTR